MVRGKARRIRSTRIMDWTALPDSNAVLALVEVQYERGEPDTYFLPLGLTFGKDAEQARETFPNVIVSPAISSSGTGFLQDAVCDDGACAELLSFIEHAQQAPTRNGMIRGVPGARIDALRGPAEPPWLCGAGQRNRAIRRCSMVIDSS